MISVRLEDERTQTFSGVVCHGQVVDPQELLVGLAQSNLSWEIDFSQASEEEVLHWGLADLIARIVRAISIQNKPVFIAGMPYSDPGEIEDAIAESGMNVQVERDDESGLWIGMPSRES